MATEKVRWTVEDDRLLCSAWLNAGTDPVVGVNQGNHIFWKRIEDYYDKERKPHQAKRNNQSMQNHWGNVRKAVNKFVGCFDHIVRRKESGFNDEDTKVSALMLYQHNEGETFKYIHCWEVLKDQEKWISHMELMNKNDKNKGSNRKRTKSPSSTDLNLFDSDTDGNEEVETLTTSARPIGTKAAKAASSQKKKLAMDPQNIADLDRTEHMKTFISAIEELRKDKKGFHEDKKRQHEENKRIHEENMRKHEDNVEMQLLAIDHSKLDGGQYAIYQRRLKSFLKDD